MNNTPGHNTIRLTGFVRSWEVSAITATANSSAGALLPDEGERVGTVAKFFRALGDANRLRLLEFLVDGEHSVGDCVAHVGLAQSRVSTHLACLADCGYITARRASRWCYYRVTDPRVADLVLLLGGGVISAVLLWIIGAQLLLPARLGMPIFSMDMTGMQKLIGHLVFGLVTAAVLWGIRRKTAR